MIVGELRIGAQKRDRKPHRPQNQRSPPEDILARQCLAKADNRPKTESQDQRHPPIKLNCDRLNHKILAPKMLIMITSIILGKFENQLITAQDEPLRLNRNELGGSVTMSDG